MRELKFRIWNGKNGFCTPEFVEANLFNILRSHPEQVQQYTGLKDKNNKEIYEGDIIKVTPDEYDGGCIGHIIFEYGTYVIATELEKRRGIYWETYKTWNDGMHDWHSLENTDCDRVEIVSHIYEHPELVPKSL